MKKILLITLSLLILTCLSADKIHSTKLSLAMSALVPGSGDIYARNYAKGGIAIFREVALIAGLFHFNKQADSFDNSAKQFAYKVTGAPLNASSDYYDLLAQQISSQQFNENVRLNAQNYYGYGSQGYYEFVNQYSISEQQAWDWESSENYKKYRSYRAQKQKNNQNANIVIGALIVNHIYSAISTAISTSNNNKEFIERHSINVQPDLNHQGVLVNYGFKF